MKVWHKILVAPGVAIAFLLALGAATYVALSRQNATVSDMFESHASRVPGLFEVKDTKVLLPTVG